jgi:hypothetical protein
VDHSGSSGSSRLAAVERTQPVYRAVPRRLQPQPRVEERKLAAHFRWQQDGGDADVEERPGWSRGRDGGWEPQNEQREEQGDDYGRGGFGTKAAWERRQRVMQRDRDRERDWDGQQQQAERTAEAERQQRQQSGGWQQKRSNQRHV